MKEAFIPPISIRNDGESLQKKCKNNPFIFTSASWPICLLHPTQKEYIAGYRINGSQKTNELIFPVDLTAFSY